jgi:hypothetical protein
VGSQPVRNVDAYQVAQGRTEELRGDARRLQAEAARVVAEQKRAPSRLQQIVWRNHRRETKRLRALAEAQGVGGLFPTHPSQEDLESWGRRLR